MPVKHVFNLVKTGLFSTLRLLLAYGSFCIAALGPTAWAASIEIGSGTRVERLVKSMKDLRDKNLVKQRFDYSCGAAALATILRYGFGDKVTERDILTQMFSLLAENDKETRLKKGFSLLDLQKVAQARAYKAQGFRLVAKHLAQLAAPVIVFINPRGYKHFAVLRGIRNDRVYLADPARGNVRMPVYVFLESWLQDDGKGIIFVVEPKTGPPKDKNLLSPSVTGLPQPEIMTAREMLAVGSPFVRLPEMAR